MTTQDRIAALIAKYAGLTDPLTPETNFARDLAFDSLDLISLAMEIEDEFSIVMPDSDVDLPELGTLGGVCGYVEGKLAAVDA